jgi:hypothetical protein
VREHREQPGRTAVDEQARQQHRHGAEPEHQHQHQHQHQHDTVHERLVHLRHGLRLGDGTVDSGTSRGGVPDRRSAS